MWERRKDGQEVLRLNDLTTEKNLQDLCFWRYTCVPYFSYVHVIVFGKLVSDSISFSIPNS